MEHSFFIGTRNNTFDNHAYLYLKDKFLLTNNPPKINKLRGMRLCFFLGVILLLFIADNTSACVDTVSMFLFDSAIELVFKFHR